MAYSELIKNFQRVRDYMREFFVYGFKSRDEYDKKSARSYDDERRRLESWLGDYMGFRQKPDGQNVFLSVDSRNVRHNPLYKAWKARSFTDGDITLHFILFDILNSPETEMTLNGIMERIDGYLAPFHDARTFDESTVRKKLGEYVSEGIVVSEKRGKTVYYRRAESVDPGSADVLDFFSEVAPCGVVGSFLLDKGKPREGYFTFKHHYITGAMDSEVVCSLFAAMREKRYITLETVNRKKDKITENHVIPLQIMISVQGGRQYLMAYAPRFRRITSFRIDNIVSVSVDGTCEKFDEYRDKLDGIRTHIWGVSTQSTTGARMEHVEFEVRYDSDESFIHKRLVREKRCGTVEKIDEHTSRFSADVFDSSELIPWIRTFTCRISSITFSNKEIGERFLSDYREMYALYGLKDGEDI